MAENLLKQALGDETLATLSKDDIKAKVLPHFNNDASLYDVCQESIDNLFQKYLSLISRDEQKKTLGKINEGSDDTCQALMKESKASQEACDKIEVLSTMAIIIYYAGITLTRPRQCIYRLCKHEFF